MLVRKWLSFHMLDCDFHHVEIYFVHSNLNTRFSDHCHGFQNDFLLTLLVNELNHYYYLITKPFFHKPWWVVHHLGVKSDNLSRDVHIFDSEYFLQAKLQRHEVEPGSIWSDLGTCKQQSLQRSPENRWHLNNRIGKWFPSFISPLLNAWGQ